MKKEKDCKCEKKECACAKKQVRPYFQPADIIAAQRKEKEEQ